MMEIKFQTPEKLYFYSDDFNRVVLEPEEGVPDSDYINASYVDVSSEL